MTDRPNSSRRRDVAYHLHSQTNLAEHELTGPTVIERGEGVFVFDEDGKRYMDVMAGLWSVTLGYSEKRLVAAATRQMQRLPFFQTFAHKSHHPAIDLAERLISIAPVPMSKVLFQSSGSEAVDAALKLVWYYHNAIGKPGKKKVIARTNAYHGTTIASASLTGLPHMHRDFDLPISRILHVECPHFYRFGAEGEDEEAFATRLAESLEARILAEDPDTVAAFFAEPIMGTGGVLIPPATYFRKIQAVLKKYDVLLVADEVICGFGRTGRMWGSQEVGMQPDMITCAKGLSSSYLPISALLLNEKIYQGLVAESRALGIFGHGHTYSAHPVSAAVALEALNIYEQDRILDHVAQVSPVLQGGLRNFADHPLVGEVRGVGLMGAIEIVKNKATKASFDPSGKIVPKMSKQLESRGFIIRALGQSLAFAPPLIVEASHISALLDATAAVLDETYAELKASGELASVAA
ncbi:aspartate aminotransferase family protein [Mesorhizobium sp. B2-4-13]|uniref:aspartate aminotransferase family protein n=1 Tax=Mesorhizobium sp. B2-4-13 TaxID=2589936 RepID=UPI00114E6A9A|nr:aspartate aminotransferase family protein [Mesorhizobium sp. B2-4-13]TPK87032.1 aspartate aminotransferase family protein [Mesorhizobium sp. B2-4-13]